MPRRVGGRPPHDRAAAADVRVRSAAAPGGRVVRRGPPAGALRAGAGDGAPRVPLPRRGDVRARLPGGRASRGGARSGRLRRRDQPRADALLAVRERGAPGTRRRDPARAPRGRGMSTLERILWIDAAAGASGDMILGALVDLGAPLREVKRAVASLPLEGVKLSEKRVTRGAVAAAKIDVTVRGDH